MRSEAASSRHAGSVRDMGGGGAAPKDRTRRLSAPLMNLNLFGSDAAEATPPPPPPPPWQCALLSEDVDVRLVVTTAIKFADLGHVRRSAASKPLGPQSRACSCRAYARHAGPHPPLPLPLPL